MSIIPPLKKMFNWQLANKEIPYKIYTAYITQTATDNPTAKVLQNNTGIDFKWVRTGVGTYAVDLGNIVPSNFVFPGFGNGLNAGNADFRVIYDWGAGLTVAGAYFVYAYSFSGNNGIELVSMGAGLAGTDDLSNILDGLELFIEIRIY